VLAWQRYTQVERSAAAVWDRPHNTMECQYWNERLSLAQRRYLMTMETLAKVRRLALPALLVNMLEKQ